MPTLPVAPWTPDQAPLHGGTTIAQNVVPRSQSSYGPFMSPQNQVAGPDIIVAAIGVEDVTGIPYVFAASNNSLYRLSPPGLPSLTWTNVTGTSGPTGTPVEQRVWSFAQFKNQIIAAWGGQVLLFDMTAAAGTFGPPTVFFNVMAAGAPNASYVAVIKSFVFLGSVMQSGGPLAPYRVWWSAINDPTNFPTPGSTTAQEFQSDYNDSAGSLGAITGIVSDLASADGAILFQHGIQRVIYVGPPDVFEVPVAVGTKGCICPTAWVRDNNRVYYLGEDGFYSFDGANAQAIGAGRVDRWFFANWNPHPEFHVFPPYLPKGAFAFSDPVNRCVGWLFTSNAATGNVCDTVLIYSWAFDMWSYAKVNGKYPFIYAAVTGLPKRAALFDGAGALNTFGAYGGSPLAATVSTLEAQPVPGARCFVRSARPLTDGGSPSVQIASRNMESVAQTVGPAVPTNIRGEAPQRVETRYVQALIEQPAGASWTHIEGVELTLGSAGTR